MLLSSWWWVQFSRDLGGPRRFLAVAVTWILCLQFGSWSALALAVVCCWRVRNSSYLFGGPELRGGGGLSFGGVGVGGVGSCCSGFARNGGGSQIGNIVHAHFPIIVVIGFRRNYHCSIPDPLCNKKKKVIALAM